jgi:phosphoglycerate dehydrogenase-like enzyme
MNCMLPQTDDRMPEPAGKYYAFLITLVFALGGFLFGYDLVIVSGAQLFLRSEFALSPNEFGFATSSAILGCIAGPFLGAWLCDRLGRRGTLFVAGALFAAGTIGTTVPRDIVTGDKEQDSGRDHDVLEGTCKIMDTAPANARKGNDASGAFKVVLVASDHPVPEWVARRFDEAKVGLSHYECHSRRDLEQCVGDADVIWFMSARGGLVVEENMDLFKKAGVVIKCGSGTDNIDHAACTKRGIIVAHTPEDPIEPASDHAIALLFGAVRQTVRHDRLIRRGVCNPQEALPLGRFTAADLGIVGFGRIGKRIVEKLSGFQMTVRAFDPYLDEETIARAGGKKVDLKELLRQSQYIVVQCPLTDATRNLIGETELRMMRADAVLVNNARAGIVVEKALYKALREGWIKAAALDVFEDHVNEAMLSLENLTLTPHLGGWPANYPDDLFVAVVDVILDVSRGRMPKWIVNKGVKSRWNLKLNAE